MVPVAEVNDGSEPGLLFVPLGSLAEAQTDKERVSQERQKAAYDAVQDAMSFTYDVTVGAANGGYDKIKGWWNGEPAPAGKCNVHLFHTKLPHRPHRFCYMY
jgi:hypothetical protein